MKSASSLGTLPFQISQSENCSLDYADHKPDLKEIDTQRLIN